MARKIVITSGKGGVGKTTVCANLGVRLANLGFRVLLVDTDIGLNNLDVVMGIENKVMFTLTDVVAGKCRPKQALVENERFPTLFIMPSAETNPDIQITPEKINDVLLRLDPMFDYILIDCPAGIGNGFHRAASCAEEAIVVVTPHISSLRDASKVVAKLGNYALSSINLVINRVRGDMLLSGEMISVEKIMEILDESILGVIPDDDALGALSAIGAFSFNASGTKAFAILAENLQNGGRKIYDCTYRYRGMVGTIRRNLRRRI